jgi:hypothetical protein
MKIIGQTMILLMLATFLSCDDETVDNSNSSSEELVSIVEEFVQSGSSATYSINNELNTGVEWSYGTIQNNTFENGRITSIENYQNGSLTILQTFAYDNVGRLISFVSQNLNATSPSASEIVYTFEYVGNQILANKMDYDANDEIMDSRSYSFVLNDDNQIIQYQSGVSSASWNASYTNGNLISFTASGYGDDVDGSATFTYTSQLAVRPYFRSSFRYGSEWRNNTMLTQTGNYAFKQLAELGNNYLSRFSFIRDTDGQEIVSQIMTYDYDNLGRLVEQNRNKIFFSSNNDYVITYSYQ